MCGIAGILFPSRSESSVGLPSLESMLNRIKHRGPDDHGTWTSADGNLFLGHRRLSILDLSANGHQPMIGPRGGVIVYNGELYNHTELRSKFSNEKLRSNSDTEVLLRCIEEEGEQALEKLNGMFAFAQWDHQRRTLLLARDRVGIKPLYYTTLGNIFAFASEIKALLVLPWVSAQLDEKALSNFLVFNHLQSPETMFKGISKVHPGHFMVVEDGKIKTYRPFWKINSAPSAQFESDVVKGLQDRLESSVRRQMVADVPVGVFLSGGVDSSGLVALASQRTSVPLKTYSVGFEGAPAYTELQYAREVSQRFQTEHFERVIKRNEIADFLPNIVDIYDEPLADATSIPIYFISELARQNGTIAVLTGDGADELFCGYRRWVRQVKALKLYRKLLATPQWARTFLRNSYGVVDSTSPRYEFLNQASHGHEVYWGAGGFKLSALQSILAPDYVKRLNDSSPYDQIRSARSKFKETFPGLLGKSEINWLCYYGFQDAVPNFYCHRADRMGMAHSIEIRVPYLDNEIVDFAFGIPPASKLDGGIPKAVLKRALEKDLPHDILYRRKMGFCVPVREWCTDIFLPYLDSRISHFCRETGIFQEAGLRRLIDETRAGNPNHAFSLWNLFFFIRWMDRWILKRQ